MSLPKDHNQPSKTFRLVEGERLDNSTLQLDQYLKKLLLLHEVLASDEILLFLDEEASSMSVDPNSLEPISVHDLLLLSENKHTVTVSREEEANFQMRQGNYEPPIF